MRIGLLVITKTVIYLSILI